MLLICMNRRSATGTAVSGSGRFAVNILSEDQADTAMRFAGKAADKFAGVEVAGGGHGEPLLREALATLECRVVQEVAAGTHTVFLAEVERASSRTGTPLAYFRGRFGRLEMEADETTLREIRDRVLNRDLPIGTPLDASGLAERLSMPRGPVYHALAKLTGDGLFTRNGDGTFLVRPVTFGTVHDALQARATIEIGVAARRVGRLTPGELAGCRDLIARMRQARDADEHQWVAALTAFLEYVVGLSDNEPLLEAYRRINIPALILELRDRALTATEPERHVRDHQALVDAYANGDLDAAVTAIEHRTRTAVEGVRREIHSAGGRV
jgi:DNA-binding GntR family transcriptional regulator